MDEVGEFGPYLQTAMFDRAVDPTRAEVEELAERARLAW